MRVKGLRIKTGAMPCPWREVLWGNRQVDFWKYDWFHRNNARAHTVAKESESKANKHLRLIRALFIPAVKGNWIAHNPTTGIDRFPETPGKRYVPSVEDINKVLELAKPIDRLYLLVMAHMHGRVRAVNELRWEDVHGSYASLYTRKARRSDLKEIRAPMNDVLRDVLTHIPRISEYGFPNEKTGKPFDYRDKFLPKLCRKAGVRRFMYHALLHFGALKLDEQGAPLTFIQGLLGYGRATTTDIYVRNLRGEARGDEEAGRRLNAQISRIKAVSWRA